MAVADPNREDLEPHQRQLVIHLSHRWVPTFDLASIEAVLDTANVAARSGLQPRTEQIAGELCRGLPPSEGQRLLSDLGLMARADGHLTRHEAEVIGLVRTALAMYRTPAV